ncbi:MAG: glycosyl hydrolase [Candidatus Pacearchaeota archaeon]|jgi:hypothetical protein
MDFGQKYEPKGNKIIHGAGQSLEMFKEYWNAVENHKPALYMTYVKIQNLDNWIKNIKEEIKQFPNVMLQIGLNLRLDGKDKTKEISEGKYDKEFEILFRLIEEFSNPVFLRIGYEFDKKDKYNPETFVLAWRHIVDKFRLDNIQNIATVWCSCPYPGTSLVEPYYPGDNYVDWFGIDVFSKDYINESYKPTQDFLKLAEKHKKPVMIGESSPARIGVDKGEESWDDWFKVYFKLIEKNPIIKAFCYINWDWGKDWKQPEWLNGRIHENEIVRKNFIKELSKKKYIHNLPTEDFLKIVQTKKALKN